MTLLVDCEEVEMEILKVLKRYDPEGCYFDWHIEGEFMQINASIKVIEQKRRELHYPDYLEDDGQPSATMVVGDG